MCRRAILFGISHSDCNSSSVSEIKKTLFWWILVAILAGGVIIRWYFWIKYVGYSNNYQYLGTVQFSNYQTKIYFYTLCRLDDIVFGITVALLKNFYKNKWASIIVHNRLMLKLGLLGICVYCALFLKSHYCLLATTIGYPILGISFGLLIVATLNTHQQAYKLKIPGVQTIAILSYSIYLIEKPINHVIMLLNSSYNLIRPSSILIFIFSVLVNLVIAYLLYHSIELPFLRLRDRILPKFSNN